jgi:2-iminoacetate synthase ThiH
MGLGSGIREKPITVPGSRGQKVTGSWIRIHNTANRLTLPSLAVLMLLCWPNKIGRTDSGRRLRQIRRRRVPALVPGLPSASGRHSLCPPPLMKRGLRLRERKWKHFLPRLLPECFAPPREWLRN